MPESSVAGALLHGGPLSRTVVARIGAVGTAGLLVFLAVSDVVDDQVWDATLFACGGGLLLVAGLMWTLPWERLSGHGALIWPTIVLTVLLIAGITEGELARLFLSFAGLTFLYIGVTQPPRTEIFLLPLAGALRHPARGEHPRFRPRGPLRRRGVPAASQPGVRGAGAGSGRAGGADLVGGVRADIQRGIAVMDGQADSTRTLAEADAALYAAKAAGRNTTRIHAPT